MMLDWLGRQFLFAFDPETAHALSLAALKTGLPLAPAPTSSERLRVRVAGLDFPNPLGMAAGYDKNAEVPDALLRLGFAFAEVGTVTPLPQAGNARPRIFRLPKDRAVINRLGFNNEGYEPAFRRLQRRTGRVGVVGVNVGANKASADRIGDYERGVLRFAGLASYLTVNISSPNTPGLRDLQTREGLKELLARVTAAREASGFHPPLFLKIAPDLDELSLDHIATEVRASGIDGVVVSNTTLSRAGLRERRHAEQSGGLSGRPLFERSTIMLAKLRRRLGPTLPLIGVGGVDSTETALEKIRAGADLVQLYGGMIYGGPALPGAIIRGMDRFAAREGLAHISEIRDRRVDHWADRPIPTP